MSLSLNLQNRLNEILRCPVFKMSFMQELIEREDRKRREEEREQRLREEQAILEEAEKKEMEKRRLEREERERREEEEYQKVRVCHWSLKKDLVFLIPFS